LVRPDPRDLPGLRERQAQLAQWDPPVQPGRPGLWDQRDRKD